MANTDQTRRRVTGWGFEGAQPGADEVAQLAGLLQTQFPGASIAPEPPVDVATVRLPEPRLAVPDTLAACCAIDVPTRCLHALGRSYPDALRAQRGAFEPAPDVVATPRDAAEVAAVLEWCEQAGAAAIPFGGGTSVVGGVNPPDDDRPVVALQLRAMDRVREVDAVSQAAHIEAGATGPVLEDQLRAHGFTLRFFPQSFELSTLGGWIATRAGGHFATGATHIDDLVEAVSAVTPLGLWSSRRLPASGAGPSPDRWLLGSEGILGVITDAWVRLQPRPRHRAAASVRFADFAAGLAAVRAVTQAGFTPAGCRLLDPVEALLNGANDGSHAVLVLGFESAHAPVGAEAEAVVALCRDKGGECPKGVSIRDADEAAAGADDHADDPGAATGHTGATTPDVEAATRATGPASDEDAASAWRRSFLRAPYLRDALISLGVIAETFETAVTWNAAEALHAEVTAAVQAALHEVCGDGLVTCRTTHAYPDGVAPYFTVLAPGRRGSEITQWREVKAAASEAVLAAGGTITHHHAIGRDHRPWYDRQRPDPFAAALRAAKATLDPSGILNPGVLVG